MNVNAYLPRFALADVLSVGDVSATTRRTIVDVRHGAIDQYGRQDVHVTWDDGTTTTMEHTRVIVLLP